MHAVAEMNEIMTNELTLKEESAICSLRWAAISSALSTVQALAAVVYERNANEDKSVRTCTCSTGFVSYRHAAAGRRDWCSRHCWCSSRISNEIAVLR